MSERERWIVYPLLFLALGAALRDKIIKTTESQRIKCQGLYVFDSDDQPLLILGPEQFPELRPTAPNLLRVDELQANRVRADVVEGTKVEGVQFVAPQDRVGKLVANHVAAATVVAHNFVLTDGKNNLRIDGRLTVPIMRFIAGIAARYQASQQAAVDSDDESVQQDEQPPAEPGSNPAGAEATPDPRENEPASDADRSVEPSETHEPGEPPLGDRSAEGEPQSE
jgi:hypothetical protein